MITCGIYAIYWFIVLTDEINTLSDNKGFSGGVSFLLSLVTCGIYSYFWAYDMGKRINAYNTQRNLATSDNSILYIILQIFGLGIVNYCLMQNDLNKIAEAK